MFNLGDLIAHREMEWLKLRVKDVGLEANPLLLLEVENKGDPSTHGVQISFDAEYLSRNYNHLEFGVGEKSWEV